jgi:hypothetical protein
LSVFVAELTIQGFPNLSDTLKKSLGTPAWKNRRRRKTGRLGKIPALPLYLMKITVDIAALTSEQVKFLSELGMFPDDDQWESGWDPDEFQEAMEWLKWAGIEDVFEQFGE